MPDPRRNPDPNQTTDLPGSQPVDQTTDLPAPKPAETTDLPAGRPETPETARRGDTSMAPRPGLVPTIDTDHGAMSPTRTFDPSRTGGYVPADRDDDPGEAQTFAGHEILGELGRGGMGVVWKARHVALDRVVALKMILAGPHATPSAIERFRTEAQAVARMQHPGIVQIYEVGEFDGMPFFSLEFVDGGPLSKKIAREPQPPKFAAGMVEKLARAVQYAHDRGVVHRDLKPANVLLAKDGSPKITDFGLAKRIEEDSGQTQAGQVLGTPSYMAPEQASGDLANVGPAADVYALGAILYDLLTGRPPFAGSSVLDTLEMVRTREPVAPSQLSGLVPKDIETICLKCLQKQREKRYASAGELADDLRRFLDGRPITARPVGSVEKAWRWAKRNPTVAGLTTAIAALLIAFTAVSWWLKGEADDNARQANTARDNEEVARKNAEDERDAKEKARAAAELAKTEAVTAWEGAAKFNEAAVNTARGVLIEVDNRMRNKASLAPLRRAIIDIAMKDLAKVREVAAKNPSPLEGRTEARGYANTADILLRGNEIEAALEVYDRAFKINETLAKTDPDNPALIQNRAALTNLRADIELRLGNGAKARQMYADALKHREHWLRVADEKDKPRGRVGLAQAYGLLGQTDLAMGDPAAAGENYTKSGEVYDSLPVELTRDPLRRQEMASLQDRLGDVAFRLGKPDIALTHYKAALSAREAQLKLGPRNAGFLRDVALSRITLGDFYLAGMKDVEKAKAEYAAAFKTFTDLLKADPDSMSARRDLSAVHYRLGVIATDPDQAKAEFAACLKYRKELAKIDPKDTQGQIELMLILGRVGRAADAEKVADGLLAQAGKDPRVLFQTACGMSVAAGGAADAAAKERCLARAIEVLGGLVKAGWKDRASLETDPDLEAARGDARFAGIVAPLPPVGGR